MYAWEEESSWEKGRTYLSCSVCIYNFSQRQQPHQLHPACLTVLGGIGYYVLRTYTCYVYAYFTRFARFTRIYTLGRDRGFPLLP